MLAQWNLRARAKRRFQGEIYRERESESERQLRPKGLFPRRNESGGRAGRSERGEGPNASETPFPPYLQGADGEPSDAKRDTCYRRQTKSDSTGEKSSTPGADSFLYRVTAKGQFLLDVGREASRRLTWPFTTNAGAWYLGSKPGSDVAAAVCYDAANDPVGIAASWRVYDGKAWIATPSVKIERCFRLLDDNRALCIIDVCARRRTLATTRKLAGSDTTDATDPSNGVPSSAMRASLRDVVPDSAKLASTVLR